MSRSEMSETEQQALLPVFQISETEGCPVFSIAISAGMADSWNATEQVQKDVVGKIDDIARLAGWDLAEGRSCLDVVQDVIVALEDLPYFNAGHGASANEDGIHLCSAAIMDGPHVAKMNTVRYGGVESLWETKNPIKAARAVLESGRYGLLTGGAADEFALKSECEKVSNKYFDASGIEGNWQSCTSIQSLASGQQMEFLEGVGAVVMDKFGRLAAGVSTGGMSMKERGKMDDMSMVFTGLMVDSNSAVVCTGAVDELLKHGTAGKVCALNEYSNIEDATTKALLIMAENDCRPCSVIAVDSTGKMSIQSSGRMLLAATCSSSAASDVRIYGNSVPVAPNHILKYNKYITAGLTRYPVCTGHTIATINNCDKITKLGLHMFFLVMENIWIVAKNLSITLGVKYVGLANDGTGSISLLPFHGLDSAWVAEPYQPMDLNPLLGYLTSKKGPQQDFARMEPFYKKITDKSRISGPGLNNNTFYGRDTDTSYFARVIRGQVAHYRIWEDEGHIAFLDQNGSANGTAILIPRRPIKGGILSMTPVEYTKTMVATYAIVQLLKAALVVDKVGIFFEGFEQGYASIKFVPLGNIEKGCFVPAVVGPPPFYDRYPGYLTTQPGPRAPEFEALSKLKRELMESEALEARRWFRG